MVRWASAGLLLCVACAGAPPDPRFPALDLPRTGTIGWHARDLPPPVAIVNVRRDGRVSLVGEEVPLPGLEARFALLADAARDGGHPDKPSLLHLVLRCDRDVPWRTVQIFIRAAADPAVRANRLLFAVLPETGADEGTLALYLPLPDCGCPDPARETADDPVQVRLVPGDGPVTTPADLAAAIAAEAAVRHANLAIDPRVPVGDVLGAVDALFRAGVTRVMLVGLFSPVRAAPPSRVTMLISGRPVPRSASARLPPVARVDGLAGCTETYEVLMEEPIIRDAKEQDPDDLPFEEPLTPK